MSAAASSPLWLTTPILRTRDRDRAGALELQRRALSGELTRVVQGAYVDTAVWRSFDSQCRHRVRVRCALPDLPSNAQIARESAAALYRWPRLGPWPERVHAIVPGADHEIRRRSMTLHCGPAHLPKPTFLFQAVPVADAAVTAAMLAAGSDFPSAVVLLDHVLRSGSTSRADIERALPVAPARGAVRAVRAVRFANGVRESVGESYAAARMQEIGVPEWQEQHEFRYGGGGVDRVDFWLPDLGIVVEFDGRVKYEDAAMLDGRSARQVLWDEKRREDRIRALPEVRGFIRVTWWHLVDPDRLRALFREHGVPLSGRRSGQGRG